MKLRLAILLSCAAACLVAAGAFTLRPEDGRIQVLLDGAALAWLEWCPEAKGAALRRRDEVLADGRRVFNLWHPVDSFRYRLEAVLSADGGAAEFSTVTEWPAYSGSRASHQMSLLIPWEALGEKAAFEGYRGFARGVNLRRGTLARGRAFETSMWRFLTLRLAGGRAISLDCNPIGPGECCASYPTGIIRGGARVAVTDDGVRLTFPNGLDSFGGMTGAKMRLRLGGMENYDQDHAMRSFRYMETIPASRLLCFGAARHGKAFAAADDGAFTARRGFGWTAGRGSLRRIEFGSGAYYSHYQGKDARFRLAGLKRGLHLITVGAGNPNGTANEFSVTVNGQELLARRQIQAGRFLTATIPIWIDGGEADLDFQGEFILSVIADQHLLADAEDYQCRRGFWAVDGFEPSVLFRNAGYLPHVSRFRPDVQEAALPVAGRESSAPLRTLAAVVDSLDHSGAEAQWLSRVRFEKAGGNTSCLNELASPAALEKYLDGVCARGRNTIMLSGMHARHIYPGSEERVLDYIRRFCEAAHRRGLKVIEHHDLSLLYNTEAGFRTLAERLSEVNRSVETQLPGAQLCVFNPEFQARCLASLKKLAACGVDGFQLDECTVFGHAGSCRHCREAFRRETGWEIPMDETTGWQGDFRRELTRVWYEWKVARTRNLKAALARELRKVNPHLAMTAYGTLHTFLSPYGLRSWNTDQLVTARAADMYGHECMAENTLANARMFVPGQKLFDCFRFLDGTPIFTWLYTNCWQTSYFGYAVCNMNAQSPVFYGKYAKCRRGEPDFLAFDSGADNMERGRARPTARLALLFSGQTRNWEEQLRPVDSLFGCAQTLEELHIPYQFLGEDALELRCLAPFKAIYLGAASCLSDQQLEVLRAFAEQGGLLLFEPGAATKDQFGRPRGHSVLARLMGIEFPDRTTHPVAARQATWQGKSFAFAEALPYAPFAARGGGAIGEVRLAEGGTAPLACVRPCGKGAVAFLPLQLSRRMYARNLQVNEVCAFQPDEGAAALYRALLRRLLEDAGAIPLATDAPAKVYVTLLEDDATVYVHLLNGLGAGVAKGEKVPAEARGPSFPRLERPIHVTVPATGAREAFAVSPDFPGRRRLEMQPHADGTATVTIPPDLLKIYTIVRIPRVK